MPFLRITADDYGLCPGVNAGIEELAAQGAISAVSVMVHDQAKLETAHRLGHLPVRTGLHLVFVEERPLSAPSELSGLLTRSGTLPRTYRDLFARLVLRPWLAQALASEARRQMERFAALGLRLDFINSHQHTHMFPTVWHALRDLWSAWPAS
jgi:chitin disaccharide deacetylase